MAKKSSDLSLLKALSRAQGNGGVQGLRDSMSRVSRSQEGLGSASGRASSPIQFGKPTTSSSSSSKSTGSEWTTLLKQTASQGLISAIGGIGGGELGGLGSLVSAFAHLFGGQSKTPMTYQAFSLPASTDTTAYVGSHGTTVYGGNAEVVSSGSQWTQDHSAQIAQAVKTALLHSSSLNDVIAEI